MPIRLTKSTVDTSVTLTDYQLVEDENGNYYRFKGDTEETINIPIKPLVNSKWQKDSCEIYIFENKYLDAESDVYEVYVKELNERLGLIFPATILDSEDINSTKNLNDYKSIAYLKLFDQEIEIDITNGIRPEYLISELLGNIIICLIHNRSAEKIGGFRLDEYLLSFYKYGYIIYTGIQRQKTIYDKTNFVNKMRNERKRVTLSKSAFDITNNSFTNSLFKEHLLQSENYLVRFILLYQIIEHFIQDEFNQQFDSELENYTNNKGIGITKNDLRENIINLSKESSLIIKAFSNIKISDSTKDDFIEEYNTLTENIGRPPKKDIYIAIYDIRNLLTHNLRNHIKKNEDSLIKIVEKFEDVMIELLIKYDKQVNSK